MTAVHGAATGIASKKQKALAPGGTRESEYTDNGGQFQCRYAVR